MSTRSLALAALLAALCPACAHTTEAPTGSPEAGSRLEALARKYPAAGRYRLLARGPASDLLRAGTLLARADDRGLELRRVDDPRPLRVRRDGAPRVEGATLDQGGSVADVDGGGIEDLVETQADLDYQLELPEGMSLRAVGDLAEVRDANGRPFLRVSAPVAWDAAGREHAPHLSVVGRDRLRVSVDAAAPRPVLIDPRWTTPTLPALPRRGHTTTPLGDGRLLLVGGGSTVSEYYDPSSGDFALGPVLTEGRAFHTTTPLPDGRLLVAGGRTSAGAALASTELVDPRLGAVTTGPKLASARMNHTGTALNNGKVLLAGGTTGGLASALSSTELFDSAAGTLSAGASLSAKRTQHTATRLASGQVVFFGGVQTNLSQIQDLFDATGTARSAGPTSVSARLSHATLQLPDGRLFVIGGEMQSLAGAGVYDTTELCPSGPGACVAGPKLATLRTGLSAARMPNNTGLVIGGTAFGLDAVLTVPETELLTTAASTVLAETSSVQHRDHTATQLPSGNLFVFGGDDPTADVLVADRVAPSAAPGPFSLSGVALAPLPTGEVLSAGGQTNDYAAPVTTAGLYSLTTKTWTATGALNEGRVHARALTLDDGRVLVVGSDRGASQSTAEIYDRATGKFKLVAMKGSHARPTVTRLPGGKVLIAGGAVAAAELFDPKTDTFADAGAMTRSRKDHAAVLLKDGRLLLAGGAADTIAEVYREGAGFTALAAPMGSRSNCRGALLPSGKVLLTGGRSRQGETFDPITGRFTPTAPSATSHDASTLSVLPTGAAVVAGGALDDPYGGVNDADVFEPSAGGGAGAFVGGLKLTASRYDFTSLLMDDGGVMHAGGYACQLCPTPPTTVDLFYDRPAGAARATVTGAPTKATVGTVIELTGTGFLPTPEPTDGRGASAAVTPPYAVFVPASSNAVLLGRTVSFTATSLKWEVPSSAHLGAGRIFVLTRGVPSRAVWINLEPATTGAACGGAGACASGFCVDGVCCDTACDGVCQACSAAKKGSGADGVCGAIPPEKDKTDACVLGLGAKCTSDAQCTTSVCVDGVCCNARCDGQCEACDVEGSFGTCVPTVGAPHGARAACATATSEDACTARVCDGKARAGCDGFVGSAVACRAASCKDGVSTVAARCDGTGACPAAVTKACLPYTCDGDACRASSCASDAECVPEYRCAIAAGATRGDCVVRTDAFCADEHTSVARDGTKKICDPYRCAPTGCPSACASSADCLGGYLCDLSSKTCVSGASADTGGDGGCATTSSPRGPAGGALLLFAVACAVGRARKRR